MLFKKKNHSFYCEHTKSDTTVCFRSEIFSVETDGTSNWPNHYILKR